MAADNAVAVADRILRNTQLLARQARAAVHHRQRGPRHARHSVCALARAGPGNVGDSRVEPR